MSKISLFCDQVIEACWLAALVIAPLFINFHSSVSFEPDKSTVVRSIALVMLAAFIIKRTALSKIKPFLKQPLFILTILLGLSYLASTFLSVLPSGSWWGSYARGQGAYSLMGYFVIFAITALTLNDRRQLERIFMTIILTSVPVVTYGFVQKLKLDVLPWGADFSTRIASTMGNPIFLASYLIMVIPLTIYLLIRSIKESSAISIKSIFYIIILLAQVACLLLTESRGPLMGLITAVFFFLVLSGLVFRKRFLALGSYIAVALVIGFFLLLALPNTPFKGLKSKMGRLSQMLEAREGAAQVRLLIWQGVVRMVQSDSYRAVVGYGPETMFVPYHKYCPAELVTSENKITFPDRSHNELFDTVVTNGLIGALLYLLLFSAIIFYAFRSLGLIGKRELISPPVSLRGRDSVRVIASPGGAKQSHSLGVNFAISNNGIATLPSVARNDISKDAIILIGLLLAFGLAGLVIPILLDKTIFIAVGVPLGMVAGAAMYLFVCTARPKPKTDYGLPARPAGRSGGLSTDHLLLIALFSALIGHFVEVQFGIDLTASRTYFYIYLAVLVVLISRGLSGEQPPAHPASGIPARPAGGRNPESPDFAQPFSTLSSFLIVTLILTTMVFDFIHTQVTEANTDQVMRVMVMLAISCLSSIVLFYLLAQPLQAQSQLGRSGKNIVSAGIWNCFWAGAGAAGVTVVFFIILISFLPPMYIPTTAIVIFYIWLFGNILALAWALTRMPLPQSGILFTLSKAEGHPASSDSVSPFKVFSSILLIVSVLVIIILTDLNPIKSDIIYKIGSGQESARSWEGALNYYRQALELSPNKGNLYGALARMCLEKYYAEKEPVKKKAWYDQCLDYLNKSIEYDAMNPTRQANLGRFYRVQGRESRDPVRRADQFNLAIKYYANACELSPQHPALRNELGEVYHEMGKLDEAIRQYERSLTISADFSETYSHIGDAYLEKSTKPTGTGADKDNAVKNYYEAVKIQARLMPDLREQNQEIMFERANVTVIRSYPNDYRAYYNLGRYYANKGKRVPATEALEKALILADDPQGHPVGDPQGHPVGEPVKSDIRQILERLKAGK